MFIWEPTEAQGPGVYGVTIRVTDDGNPPLSDYALITIAVNENNAPPVLTTIPDRTAVLGEIVSFTASATDSDLPAQLVTFDFVGEVPAGATLDATNGVFSWTANTVGTNTISIRATDHGTLALSDTKTFNVIVNGSWLITAITLSSNVVTLNWNAISGRVYNVEYKNSLNDSAWLPFATNIPATSNSAMIADTVTNAQRIYRIELEP